MIDSETIGTVVLVILICSAWIAGILLRRSEAERPLGVVAYFVGTRSEALPKRRFIAVLQL